METVDNRTFKEKVKGAWAGAKIKAKDMWDGTKQFVSENKGTIAFYSFILGPGLIKLADTAIRTSRMDKERRYDECDYYDPRTGEHWYTRKPLTSNQKLNLEQRFKNGESKGEILKSMHML